jgi:hypothetical protein
MDEKLNLRDIQPLIRDHLTVAHSEETVEELVITKAELQDDRWVVSANYRIKGNLGFVTFVLDAKTGEVLKFSSL